MGLGSNDCLKSRMREIRTYGSVRVSRQAFHCIYLKGVSRLSTRLNTMELKGNNAYRIMLKAQESADKSVKAFKDRHLNDVPPELIQQVYTVYGVYTRFGVVSRPHLAA